MPQPLSRIAPSQLRVSPLIAKEQPERSTQVAQIYAQWAVVEMYLGLLFAAIMHATARPALAVFHAMNSVDARLKAVSADPKPTAALTFGANADVGDGGSHGRDRPPMSGPAPMLVQGRPGRHG